MTSNSINLEMRNNILKLILLIFAGVLVPKEINAQINTDPGYSNDSLPLNIKIPSLQIVIDSAIVHSDILRASQNEIDQIYLKIKIQKKSWSQYLSLSASANYGLGNVISVSTVTTDLLNNIGTQSNQTQLSYVAGINFRLPLAEFITKKHEIAILKSTLDETRIKREALKKDLTLSIVEDYYKLMTLSQSFQINQDILQSIKLNFQKAQADFSIGLITISEFNKDIESKGTAEMNYYKIKNDYLNQLEKVKVISGIKFH